MSANSFLSQEARIDVVAGGDPMIVRLFEALQVQMKEGSDMSSTYVSMTESLHRGEEDYTMEETQLLRVSFEEFWPTHVDRNLTLFHSGQTA